ncbi:MAG: hypothetical protein ACW99G_14745 [Candidatus Thorarchaeota archaeon]
MQDIDKNDVETSILFNWGTPVPMVDDFGNLVETVYVRLVGDADTNRARTYALRQSAELREKLRTPDSDERVAYIPDWKSMRNENLIELVIQFKLREYVQKVTKDLLLPLPAEPSSDASLEEQEKYQKEVDEYPSVRENKVRESMQAVIQSEREYLATLPKLDLALEAENAIIAELCEQRMYDAFQAKVITLATFYDDKYQKRRFSSTEQFEDLLPTFKEQLFSAYNSININTENLKKLPGAML